jgi:stearoyl-CoA desaturase (delta-9 desaturase)
MYSLVALGVTVGFHRMLTHRSFRPHPSIKFVLLVLGSMSWEGPALEWAATHIKHHAQADREGDPHSPSKGSFMRILAGSSMSVRPAPTCIAVIW